MRQNLPPPMYSPPHVKEFLRASRRSTAPDSASTKGGLAGAPRRSPPQRWGRAVASPSEPAQTPRLPNRNRERLAGGPHPSLARILRDSRLRGWRNSYFESGEKNFFLPSRISSLSPAERPSPRAESDSDSIEILRAGVGKPTAPSCFPTRGNGGRLPTTARLDFSQGIRLRPGRWGSRRTER